MTTEYIEIECFDGITRSGFKTNKPPKSAQLLQHCYDINFNAFSLYSTGKKYYIKFSKV